MANEFQKGMDAFPKTRTSGGLPPPKPHKAGSFRAAMWAFVALLALGGAVYWLTRAPEQKDELRAHAADIINNATSGTALAGIGDILRASPPPLPPQLLNPSTEPGTLAGRSVTGLLAAPIDVGAPTSRSAGASDQSGSGERPLVFDQEPLPPATEDKRVAPQYLAEMANWLAERYKPGPRGGSLAVNAQSLNQMGGVTIAGQMKGGRSSLLRYAFHPAMLQGLYNLYINRFMEDLNAAANKQGMDGAANRDFHLALGGRASLLASALESIANLPDLGEQLRNIEGLAQKSVDINAQLATTVFELDELRSAQATRAQINAAQLRVDGLTARYRRSVNDYEQAQRLLADKIRAGAGQPLDEDSLLFLAAWVERRVTEDKNALAAVKTCASLLRDLAHRCALAKN